MQFFELPYAINEYTTVIIAGFRLQLRLDCRSTAVRLQLTSLRVRRNFSQRKASDVIL